MRPGVCYYVVRNSQLRYHSKHENLLSMRSYLFRRVCYTDMYINSLLVVLYNIIAWYTYSCTILIYCIVQTLRYCKSFIKLCPIVITYWYFCPISLSCENTEHALLTYVTARGCQLCDLSRGKVTILSYVHQVFLQGFEWVGACPEVKRRHVSTNVRLGIFLWERKPELKAILK